MIAAATKATRAKDEIQPEVKLYIGQLIIITQRYLLGNWNITKGFPSFIFLIILEDIACSLCYNPVMDKKLLVKTFRNTLGAAIYIFLVSQVMQNGSNWFGKEDRALTPFVVLSLFSLSAAVVGSLVFGQTVLLFLDGKKKESVTAAFYSIGFMAVYTLLGMLFLFVTK
jgi:hypothetical protein